MEEGKSSQKLTLKIDLKKLCIVLLVVVLALLFVLYSRWSDWSGSGKGEKKITITGQATIKAEADQYQFNPYYEKDTIDEVTKLNDQIVKKLKELGVADNQIKNNASQYGTYDIYFPVPTTTKEKYNLNLTITLDKKELSQKVQDYLPTTNPKGSITPYPSFSTSKQKELTDKARDEAIADAKKRAEKTASGLGAKIGKVLEVSEGQQDGGLYPMLKATDLSVSSGDSAERSSLVIQAGENEFSYSISVVFQLK